MDDISRWSVSRAAVKTSNALIANSFLWWEGWKHLIYEISSQVNVCHVTLLAWRQDATNTQQHQKKNIFELEASYYHDVNLSDDNNPVLLWDAAPFIKRVADVLPNNDGSGNGTLALTQHHFGSLGAPFLDFFSERAHHLQLACVCVWCMMCMVVRSVSNLAQTKPVLTVLAKAKPRRLGCCYHRWGFK